MSIFLLQVYVCIGCFYLGRQTGLHAVTAKAELLAYPTLFVFGSCLAVVAWPICVLADRWGVK